MIAIDILKLQLDDFFERSKTQTISKTIKKEELYFNKSLFELESHLFDLKEKYKVNQNLNSGIISAHILDSFSKRSTFFRSNDYALSFLVFLSKKGKYDAKDLFIMMNLYIETIKEKLTLYDIETTETGATRCFTNLRFTLKELRNYGLVYSNITLYKRKYRSLLPTPVGYLISLMESEPNKFDLIKLLPEHGDSSNRFVAPLYTALTYIKKSPGEFLISLLEKYEGIRSLENVLKWMIDDYCESVLQFIELTDNGLKVDEKELEKSIKSYYLKIAEEVNVSISLKNVLSNLSIPKPPKLDLFTQGNIN